MMKMKTDPILDRLESRLKSGTIKRRELVRRIGVSQATMNRWKNRQSKPTGLARERLEKILVWLDKHEHTSGTEEPGSDQAQVQTTNTNEVKNGEGRKLQAGEGDSDW
jgi:DNA-binding Xre family transcriptional regulator